MIINEKPRERLELYGTENISAEELIAILLRTGTKNESAKSIACRILNNYKNIDELSNVTINSLIKIKGVGKAKATSLLAAIELGKRVNIIKEDINILMNNTSNIYRYMAKLLYNEKQECFYILSLDAKLKLITKKLLFKGSLTNSVVHPREVFKEAILQSAAYIIVVHNHPSGDSSPSIEDEEITKVLFKSGEIIGIKVLDHIIIGKNNYFSFYEKIKRED